MQGSTKTCRHIVEGRDAERGQHINDMRRIKGKIKRGAVPGQFTILEVYPYKFVFPHLYPLTLMIQVLDNAL